MAYRPMSAAYSNMGYGAEMKQYRQKAMDLRSYRVDSPLRPGL